MFRHNLDEALTFQNRMQWYLLSFQGGYVNVGGFLCVEHYVSHITGTSSQIAHALYQGSWPLVLGGFFLFFSFLLGSFFSGIFTEVRRERGQIPIYIWAMTVITLIYLYLSFAGEQNIFFAAALCLACGAQNALFTQASRAVVRTTHLTGLATDLGIGLAKTIFKSTDHQGEKILNRLRSGLILSFLVGSLAATPIFSRWDFYGFLIPTLLSATLAFRLHRRRKSLEQKMHERS